MNALVVAQPRGLENDRTRLRTQNGETPVHDDAFVGLQLNHRAGLNHNFIRNPDGVGAGQRLRPRPCDLCAAFGSHRPAGLGHRVILVRRGDGVKKQRCEEQNN